MDKKEIESPKLTVSFLIWITAFLLVLFADRPLCVENFLELKSLAVDLSSHLNKSHL